MCTLRDLLRYFPRRFSDVVAIGLEDPVTHDDASDLVGRAVRLRARVERVRLARLRGGRTMSEMWLRTAGPGRFLVRFFNQPWLARGGDDAVGVERELEGVVGEVRDDGTVRVDQPRLLGRGDPLGKRPCTVRYSAVPGISEARIRVLVGKALAAVDLAAVAAADLPLLPSDLREGALSGADALRAMHQPSDVDEHERARRTFALQEAVAVFRRLETARSRRLQAIAPRVERNAETDRAVAVALPPQPTPDQHRAVERIADRLVGPEPMALLLQGDVGTGKTAVALSAVVRCIESGLQVAFLAPTAMLAEQHCQRFRAALPRARVASWRGDIPVPERRELAREIAAGEVDVVVGTHALVASDLRFAQLGLAVIDEQHRFGVAVRAALAAKTSQGSLHPHVLVLTATPIPRTMAMVVFGDLDVVELRVRPQARPPAPAVFVPREDWSRVVRSIRRHVRRKGRVLCCLSADRERERGRRSSPGCRRAESDRSRAEDCRAAFRCGC